MTEGIEVQGLTVAYRNGVTALRDASFTVPQGSVTALVGVNGAGKSTLFKALMGLLPHISGQVRIMGGTVEQALARNLVAYVPQAEEVDWTFPVLVQDVVMMGRYGHMGFLRRPSAADRAAVDAAKRALGERGPVWWTDGAPDLNRRLARNTPYAGWHETRAGAAADDG